MDFGDGAVGRRFFFFVMFFCCFINCCFVSCFIRCCGCVRGSEREFGGNLCCSF